MTRTRIIVLAVLVFAPFVFLMGAGSYHLWITGWTFIVWWPMAACLAAAYGLGWYWTRRRRNILPNTGVDSPPEIWTDRDAEAWKLVEKKAGEVTRITADEMADPKRYSDIAIALSLEIAQVYNPGAADPFGHLTLPEILTCAELVAHDLTTKVNTYVPGSHLLTVNHWKQSRKVIDWGQKALNISWLARAVLNPVSTGMQYLASRASGAVFKEAQQNVMLWFHTAFIHQLGKHLIELNSGRLRVGAAKYREIMETAQADADEPGRMAAPSLTVAVIGQVKAGKSSLVNALLGEHKAATDIVPTTVGATRYDLKLPDQPPVTIVDTAGYGLAGPTEAEVAGAVEAAAGADLVLFVTQARNAARQSDADMMQKLTAAFASKPHLKLPNMLGVLTHVDLLSPMMEWKPPYDWQAGTRTKEVQMREAADSAREQLGERLKVIVPVCIATGKEWNVQDGLTELMAAAMDDAHGTALLKLFHTESRAGAARKTVDQVLSAGRVALRALWESAKR
ncbi:GTPase family protein [Limnoglobus roseus]|nr:GTPase [Limnoglobus roseus]